MDHDALLEAGWPAHWALYTGRSEDEIMDELLPIERRLLMDDPQIPLRDVERYHELIEEIGKVPRYMDEAAIYNAWLLERELRNHKESR